MRTYHAAVRGLVRLTEVVFALTMATLVVWLLWLDRPAAYFCAAVLALLTLSLVVVRPGRRLVYAAGVVACLGSLVLALAPTDTGDRCGSVLHSQDDLTVRVIAAEDGYDPDSYLKACTENRARNLRLTIVGSALTVLLVGVATWPVRKGADGNSPAGVLTQPS
jgi:hypothetical protein